MKTLIKCYRNGLTFTLAKQIYDQNHSKYHQYNQLPESKQEIARFNAFKLIKPKKRKIVWVESLNNIHEILASILQQLDYEASPSWRRTSKHLNNSNQGMRVIDQLARHKGNGSGIDIVFYQLGHPLL